MHIIKFPETKTKIAQILVNKWVKTSGVVTAGEVICLVQAGQETIELQAPHDGILQEILIPAGTVVNAGEPLAVFSQQVQSGETTGKADKMENKAPENTVPGNVTVVVMPQAGQSMEEGTVVAWKVAVGDRIEVGQTIFEIETDKAVMEVEAVNAGRVARIVASEGAIVEVKKPVAYLAEEGVDIDAFIALNQDGLEVSSNFGVSSGLEVSSNKDGNSGGFIASLGQAVVKTPAAVSDSGRVKASPAARKVASDKGIDLTAIGAGSGPGGRILSTDVEGVKIAGGGPKSYPTTKMRRAIAKNLQYSKQTVPHFYLRGTIDAQALYGTYKQVKDQFKCSINDLIVLAVCSAIKQYPAFRSQYRETEIVEFPNVNIGIAVGTEDGLTVPVILAAETMKLSQLAARTREIVESARRGKLEGVGQGVFTITNLGMFGTEEFSAIINPSESGILAVGAIREGVKVENGAMKPTRLMTMTLSADHRVVDGVVAAQFMQTLCKILENPQELI